MKIELTQLKEKIQTLSRNSFSDFLEEKMDEFDYSNTSLAKKVFHQAEDKETREICYVPVTRQAIASWLKGTMPGSREIYVSLGMAFNMGLKEINHQLLESYMGTGLYCKNIDDAIWIAVINRLFPLHDLPKVRKEVEALVNDGENAEEKACGLLTTDLFRELEAAGTKEDFYEVIRKNREEFKDGARRFGQCLDEVIEEEYGFFDKNTEFLADIGCLHCEAQFSKIRAGKAIVTREWLLRFLLALQPSYGSIDKLLKKAQMEPLGITPVEIVIEAVAKKKSDSAANSQEIWIAIEQLCADLYQAGITVEDELSRKYDSVFSLPKEQKILFAALIGKKLMECHQKKDYGYDGEEYCRHQLVDRILFEEMNRFKKNSSLKRFAKKLDAESSKDRKELIKILSETSMEYLAPGTLIKDDWHMERFGDYCYIERPRRKSNDYYMNDIYFYSALLYSIFTGRCFVKDFGRDEEQMIKNAVGPEGSLCGFLVSLCYSNLSENVEAASMVTVKEAVMGLLDAFSFLQ